MSDAAPTLAPAPAPAAGAPADREALARARESIADVVRGNPVGITATLAAILARGHVLIEDVPGVGKTTLARATARALGCTFSRVQFTADLLPSDVLGVQILDAKSGELRFRKGPIFAHLVLADEINRASPKTQSALLEAMADGQVSIDDRTFALEPPFSVIATQNPVEQHGTYPLPESQLDRFMVSLSLGYPPPDDERALLLDQRDAGPQIERAQAVLDPAAVIALQDDVANVTLGEPVADYLLALVGETRRHPEIALGCSPRGALAWARLSRAVAYLDGRDHVLPDDVKAYAGPVLLHRIAVRGLGDGAAARERAAVLLDEILATVPAPR